MLGLKEGAGVVFEIVDRDVRIKVEQDPGKLVEDFLNTPKLKKKLSARKIKKIMLEQYDAKS